MDMLKVDVQKLFDKIEEAGLANEKEMQIDQAEMDTLYRVLFRFLHSK